MCVRIGFVPGPRFHCFVVTSRSSFKVNSQSTCEDLELRSACAPLVRTMQIGFFFIRSFYPRMYPSPSLYISWFLSLSFSLSFLLLLLVSLCLHSLSGPTFECHLLLSKVPLPFQKQSHKLRRQSSTQAG